MIVRKHLHGIGGGQRHLGLGHVLVDAASGEMVPPTRRLISEPYVPLAQINVGRLPLKIDMDAAAITTCRFFGMTTMRAMLATMAIIEPRD